MAGFDVVYFKNQVLPEQVGPMQNKIFFEFF